MGPGSETFTWKHFFLRVWPRTGLPFIAGLIVAYLLINQTQDFRLKLVICGVIVIAVTYVRARAYWKCEAKHLRLSNEFGVAYHAVLDERLQATSFEALIVGNWLDLEEKLRGRSPR